MVGVILLVGRGTAGQLLVAIVLAGGFVAMHIRSWPYKQVADNALKMTVEIQIFCTIAVGLAMKADADKSASTTGYDRRSWKAGPFSFPAIWKARPLPLSRQ